MRALFAVVFSTYVVLMACTTTVRNGDVVLAPLATLSGRVQDRSSGQPLPGVEVKTSPEGGYATTNAQGEYTLTGGLVPGRTYHLSFARAGYAPASLDGVGAPGPGEARIADVEMEKTRALLEVQGRNLLLGATANEAVFSIANAGDPANVLSYSITTTSPWLSVTPMVGDVLGEAARITVRADRLLLGTNWGVYNATLDIVTNAGSDSVAVRLVHQPQELGVITADRTLLDYGSVDLARTLRLDNPGGQPVNWELASIPTYLTAAASSGTVGAGNFLLLEFLLNRGALLPGTYVSEVRINTDSELQPQLILAVRFEVAPRVSVALTTEQLDLGADLSAKAFGLINDGNVGFDYEITWPAPWDTSDPRTCSGRPRLTTTPRTGTLAPGGTASVGVRLDRTALLPGEVTKQLAISIRQGGVEVESRVVTVRYVVGTRASVVMAVDRQSLTQLASAVNLKVSLTSPDIDACDMLANVPIQWSATVSQDWFDTRAVGGVLEMPVVPGGVVDGTAAPIGYGHFEVDWNKVPRVAGNHPLTMDVDWCSPTLGLPYSCNATHQRSTFSLTLTVPGPQIEKAAQWLGSKYGFSQLTQAAYNPFGSRLLMGPSFIGFQNEGYYWLEWDLTPGAETAYQITAGQLPNTWDPVSVPVNQRGLPGDTSMTYDWADDAYVFVWTLYEQNVPSTYTWIYRNAAWNMVTPQAEGIPGIRKTNVFYDSKRGKVFMYGGYVDELTPDDTLRELNVETGQWTVVTTALIGSDLDVTRATITYDANQDRYLVHGGKPLVPLSGNTVTAVDRTWAVDPETLTHTRLTPDASFPVSERWGGLLVHNYEQNITYVHGGCFQSGPSSAYEACYDPPLRVLINAGANPLPMPPLAAPMASGITDDRWAPGLWHLTYDSVYDRMLLTGSVGGPDPITGTETFGAGAWQLIYDRAAPAIPSLSPSSTSIQLSGGTGSFTISNNSGTPGLYRVTPINSWLSADVRAGQIASGVSLPVTMAADTSGLSPGLHRGRVLVEGAGKQSFEVQVEVMAP